MDSSKQLNVFSTCFPVFPATCEQKSGSLVLLLPRKYAECAFVHPDLKVWAKLKTGLKPFRAGWCFEALPSPEGLSNDFNNLSPVVYGWARLAPSPSLIFIICLRERLLVFQSKLQYLKLIDSGNFFVFIAIWKVFLTIQ